MGTIIDIPVGLLVVERMHWILNGEPEF